MGESQPERKLEEIQKANFPYQKKLNVYFAKVSACFFFMV